jgi:hypothetical protein
MFTFPLTPTPTQTAQQKRKKNSDFALSRNTHTQKENCITRGVERFTRKLLAKLRSISLAQLSGTLKEK